MVLILDELDKLVRKIDDASHPLRCNSSSSSWSSSNHGNVEGKYIRMKFVLILHCFSFYMMLTEKKKKKQEEEVKITFPPMIIDESTLRELTSDTK